MFVAIYPQVLGSNLSLLAALNILMKQYCIILIYSFQLCTRRSQFFHLVHICSINVRKHTTTSGKMLSLLNMFHRLWVQALTPGLAIMAKLRGCPSSFCFELLTLTVLNFWKFSSYCCLKPLMVGHGGSSAGSYVTDPTSPIPSHCALIIATSTLRVKTFTSGLQPWQNSEDAWYVKLLFLNC